MTIEELYAQIGGNYKNACARLMSGTYVARFIVKFLNDPSCSNIISAWEAGDERATFDAAHMAKGVCANLGLEELAGLASEVCEALRVGNEDLRASTDVDALVAKVGALYDRTRQCIEAFAASGGA